MPPSSTFGWLCVAHSVVDIVSRAAQIRSAQALPKSFVQISSDVARENKGPTRPHTVKPPHVTENGSVSEASTVHGESDPPQNPKIITILPSDLVDVMGSDVSTNFCLAAQGTTSVTRLTLSLVDQPIETSPTPTVDPQMADLVVVRHLQSSKVPSSRIGRLFHYGGTFKWHT